MADKPSLSLLQGDDWDEAIDQIETRLDVGHYFDFPQLESYLDQGHAVEVFDRTNAVFQLSLYQGQPGERPEGTTVTFVPRAMYLLEGLATLEARLSGQDSDGPVVATGDPEEHDGLENHLAYHSSTLYIDKDEGQWRLTLEGVDYEAKLQPGYDRSQPEPRYRHVFFAPTLKAAYVQAAAFGKLERDRRYQDRGLTPPWTPEIE